MAVRTGRWQAPLYAIDDTRRAGHGWQELAWTLSERAASALLLCAIAPPAIALGIAVAAVSGRTPLVAHRRSGWHGRTLWMLKFRTMWDEPPGEDGSFLAERVTSTTVPDKAGDSERASHPLARWMRRYSIDELPQLWHVALGEMALVGPRPITRLELLKHYGESAPEVTAVRPGITGLWQIRGRSSLTYRQRLRYDLFLVRKRCPRLLAMILWRTLPAVLRGENAC